jgi:hypothetical protein
MVDQHESSASSTSDDEVGQHWLLFEQRYDAAVAGQSVGSRRLRPSLPAIE